MLDIANIRNKAKSKEVYHTRGENFTSNVYSVPDTATAVGRTQLTFKRWIGDGLIPPPVLSCTTYGYMHYAAEEVCIIAEKLNVHAQAAFDNFHRTHTTTINEIWQSIEAYRKSTGHPHERE